MIKAIILNIKKNKYISYVVPNIKYEIMICVLLIINSVIGLTSPVFYKFIIDNVLMLKQIYLLKYIVILLISFYVWKLANDFAIGIISTHLNQMISIRLRSDILLHIMKLHMKYVTEQSVGDFISRLFDDALTVTSFLSGTFLSWINNVFNVFSIGMLMFLYNKKLTFVTIILCLCQMISVKCFASIIKESEKEIKEKNAFSLSFLNNILYAIKYIKSYRRENYIQEDYFKVLTEIKNASCSLFLSQYEYSCVTTLISFIGSLIIMIIGIHEILKGNMSIGVFFVFETLTDSFCQFSSKLIDFTVMLQSALVSFERINAIFNMPIEEYGKRICLVEAYNMEFNDVDFAYNNYMIFEKLNLHIEYGKAYALIGATGSGKTTFTYLLMGFYNCLAGEVRIGGINLDDIGIDEVRNKVTLVPQDSMLLPGSIEENIRFGDYLATDEELKTVVYVAALDSLIETNENGLKMRIEENGANLSGGQKQRICLARALLRKTPIYVFDETLSALDSDTRTIVYSRLEMYLNNKTRIYITHNQELIDTLPNVILIEEGKARCIKKEKII